MKNEMSSICDFITLTIFFLENFEKENKKHRYGKCKSPWGSIGAKTVQNVDNKFKTLGPLAKIPPCCPPATCLCVSPPGSPRHSQSVALHLVSGSVVCSICPRPRWAWWWSSGSGFQSTPLFHRSSRYLKEISIPHSNPRPRHLPVTLTSLTHTFVTPVTRN